VVIQGVPVNVWTNGLCNSRSKTQILIERMDY
jgi:hypothetical protein